MLVGMIAPGTPLAAAARLRMHGSIKLNRWLPFRASQIIAPGVGFLWRAHVAALIEGYDRSFGGEGELRWKLARLFTVASGSGPDISRSSAGREADLDAHKRCGVRGAGRDRTSDRRIMSPLL
jgi:hypothetical protein